MLSTLPALPCSSSADISFPIFSLDDSLSHKHTQASPAQLLTAALIAEEETGSVIAVFDTLFCKTLTPNRITHYSHIAKKSL